jgi:hypothetical protein
MVRHGITWVGMEVKGIGMGKTPGPSQRICKNNGLAFYLKAMAKDFDSVVYSCFVLVDKSVVYALRWV